MHSTAVPYLLRVPNGVLPISVQEFKHHLSELIGRHMREEDAGTIAQYKDMLRRWRVLFPRETMAIVQARIPATSSLQEAFVDLPAVTATAGYPVPAAVAPAASTAVAAAPAQPDVAAASPAQLHPATTAPAQQPQAPPTTVTVHTTVHSGAYSAALPYPQDPAPAETAVYVGKGKGEGKGVGAYTRAPPIAGRGPGAAPEPGLPSKAEVEAAVYAMQKGEATPEQFDRIRILIKAECMGPDDAPTHPLTFQCINMAVNQVQPLYACDVPHDP